MLKLQIYEEFILYSPLNNVQQTGVAPIQMHTTRPWRWKPDRDQIGSVPLQCVIV